jgi:exosortase/archaeosortase family protein
MTTAGLTSWLLSLVGRSHVLSGDLITTRGIAFQVIEGCSGLKSTMSLVLASVVFTDIVSRNALEKVVIVSLAPLIGVFVNGLRVLILVLSAAPAESTEHTVYGLLMMVLGVILLAGIESLLARTVFARGRRAMPIRARVIEAPAKSDRANRRLGFLAVAAWVSVLFVSVMPVGQWEIAKGPRINIETLPTEIGGWTSRGIPFDNALLGSVWFRHRIYRTYERDSDKIRVFVGLEEAPEFGRSGYSAKTKIPFSGWRSIQNLAVSNSSGVAADRLVIRYPSRSVMVHHLRLGYAPWGLEAIGSWLGIDRTNLGGWPVALVIRVEAEIDADDSSDVDLRLRHFLQKIADWYQSPR